METIKNNLIQFYTILSIYKKHKRNTHVKAVNAYTDPSVN